jgi:transposase
MVDEAVVEAYQAMRGVAFLTAVTFVTEIGDIRHFETLRQLMVYLAWSHQNHRRNGPTRQH